MSNLFWENKKLILAKLFFFTFMGPCINSVFKYNQQVLGGSSSHHQELKTVYTASGICRAFTASYRLREWVVSPFSYSRKR